MSSKEESKDSIDDYNESIWRKLGHPAFEDELFLNIKNPDWWESTEDGV